MVTLLWSISRRPGVALVVWYLPCSRSIATTPNLPALNSTRSMSMNGQVFLQPPVLEQWVLHFWSILGLNPGRFRCRLSWFSIRVKKSRSLSVPSLESLRYRASYGGVIVSVIYLLCRNFLFMEPAWFPHKQPALRYWEEDSKLSLTYYLCNDSTSLDFQAAIVGSRFTDYSCGQLLRYYHWVGVWTNFENVSRKCGSFWLLVFGFLNSIYMLLIKTFMW